MKRFFPAALILFGVCGAGWSYEASFAPFDLEPPLPKAFRHGFETRVDFSLDRFEAPRGTSTLSGLFTRARPALIYRYAPGPLTEISFRLPYIAQNVDLSPKSGGARVETRYSAGAAQPVVALKTAFNRKLALRLEASPASAAFSENPPVGEGARFGGDVLFRSGRWFFGAGHAVRGEFFIHSASATVRRNPGGVTTFAVSRTSLDNPRLAKSDYVGTVFELHGVYTDRERLNGSPVKDSPALSGRALFGFELGKINRRATHLTRVAVTIGFGDTLHKTLDPSTGVEDLRLMVAHVLYWDRR